MLFFYYSRLQSLANCCRGRGIKHYGICCCKEREKKKKKSTLAFMFYSLHNKGNSPKIIDFILHYFGGKRESLQPFKLLHLLLALNVATLTQQHVIFRHFGRTARQVVFKWRHCALPWGADKPGMGQRFLLEWKYFWANYGSFHWTAVI